MPLTKTGKKVLKKMKSKGSYGKKKGESVFYASINKHKAGTDDWHMMDMDDNSPLGRHSRKKK